VSPGRPGRTLLPIPGPGVRLIHDALGGAGRWALSSGRLKFGEEEEEDEEEGEEEDEEEGCAARFRPSEFVGFWYRSSLIEDFCTPLGEELCCGRSVERAQGRRLRQFIQL
jgi:hypothetical protein